MSLKVTKLVTLLGTASILAIFNAQRSQAQQTTGVPMATMGSEAVPEQVLVTGSLIRGAAAVGVPVTQIGAQDFVQTGALSTGDLFRTVPAATVTPGPVATNSASGNIEKATRVNLRGLDSAAAPRSLMLVDGLRFPPKAIPSVK